LDRRIHQINECILSHPKITFFSWIAMEIVSLDGTYTLISQSSMFFVLFLSFLPLTLFLIIAVCFG
jgi:hypothetical protein